MTTVAVRKNIHLSFRLTALVLALVSYVASADNEPINRRTHGRCEVQRFLEQRTFARFYRDNQGLLREIAIDEAPCVWLSQKFAQSNGEEIIVWMGYPLSDVTAEGLFRPRNSLSPAVVNVPVAAMGSSGESALLTFENLWAGLVLQLSLAERGDYFSKLCTQAERGHISREDFVEALTRMRYATAVQLAEFHTLVWLPWSEKHKFRSQRELWIPAPTETFDAWVEGFGKLEGPKQIYSKFFDSLRTERNSGK